MIHKYRKRGLIKAEKFDGSKEMQKKYPIIDSVFGEDEYFLLSTFRPFELHKGDWIITGDYGEYRVMTDNIFRRIYERCD